jgi:hypothetical protein
MKRLTKLAIGGVLALVSTGVFAQTINLPTSGNGSATLTLFSTSDATPFSYSFNLGINYNDFATLPTAPGSSVSYSLTGLAADLASAQGVAARPNLVFDVTASAITGSIATAGSFKIGLTSDPTVPQATVTGELSGALSTATNQNNSFLTNFGATNPSYTTLTTDLNYANINYNQQLNTFAWNVASSTSNALPFYELVSGRGTTSAVTSTVFAGMWSINLTTDTLTYSVPGGTAVPLPAGLWLLLSGLASTGLLARRRVSAAAAV